MQEQNKIKNDPYEVTEFLARRMIQEGVSIETIIGGLQKAGVDGLIIKAALEKIGREEQ